MPRIIPVSWMPDCTMDRIITHWTGGGYHATALDRKHYHILIEDDGQLVRGVHSIADNVSTRDRRYAAHTNLLNTRSIGVTVCSMLNARPPRGGRPLQPGPCPMTRVQYEVLAEVVADLCDRYQLDVKPTTVLGHGEVQRTLGVQQDGKWDPMVLPWEPGRPAAEVGDAFRESVKEIRGSAPADVSADRDMVPVTIQLDGLLLTEQGVQREGVSWCPLKLLATRQGWTIRSINAQSALIGTPAGDRQVKAMIRNARGFAQVRDLAEKLGWTLAWDPATRTVSLTTA